MSNKVSPRERHLMRTYGITEAQYNHLLKKQRDCCAICLRHKSEFNKNLAVDHNHVSKEIRGLVCTYCNRYRIGRHRDPDILRRVADYLEQGTGWFVPEKKKKKRKRRGKKS